VEELASQFGLEGTDVVDRLNALVSQGRLTGNIINFGYEHMCILSSLSA